MLLLKNKLQVWIPVLLVFNFIGMFDFYWELLHVSYAQMQPYQLKWKHIVIFRMMTHLLLGMTNSLQRRERPLTTHDFSSVLTVSQKMLDVSQSIVPRAAERIVSFPDRIFRARRKNGSGQLPIPFSFKCVGMLAHCSSLI